MLDADAVLAAGALVAGLTSAWSPCGFSMVETVGRASASLGTRLAACLTFSAGALAGGVATFGGLSAAGAAAGTRSGPSLVVAAAIALAAALAEARGVRIVPQIRRQVPEPWRRLMPLPVAAALYGVLLGLGFTTFVLTLGVPALAAISFALGRPSTGVAIGIAFALGRALPVAVLAPALEKRFAARTLEAMGERPRLLRGFRAAGAIALACCAAVLGVSAATAAAVVTMSGTDPSAAGGLVAWDEGGAGLVGPSAPGAQVGDLYRNGPIRLLGTDPALGGALLAFRSGPVVHVERAADLAPVVDLELPAANALAVSDTWLVYRATAAGVDRLVALPLVDPARPRVVAAARSPAQLGRPALDGDVVVYHVATRTGSRIAELNLRSGRRRVLRRSRLAALTNPSLLGNSLVYVGQTNMRQLLLLGPRRPGAADRVLYSAAAVAHRDSGFDPGHSRRTRTPPARPTAARTLWTTALSDRFAYVTLAPIRRGGRAEILRVPR